jgi:hypothetical protein
MINPGELVSGHLDIQNKCLSCHTLFGGIDDQKCVSCHTLADIGRDTTTLLEKPDFPTKMVFHESLKDQECMACHTDHKGLIPDTSMTRFNHELLAESIINNCTSCHVKPTDDLHAQITSSCILCHNVTDWKKTKAFDHELLEASVKNNCVSCHQKPGDTFHAALDNSCSECHSTTRWEPSTFDHSGFFALDQNHTTKCLTCHPNNDFKAYTCYGCHEHNASNIMAEHREEGITNITNCISCHKSANEKDMKSGGESESKNNTNEGHDEDDD